MLEIRIKKLVSRIENIESNYPGLVLNVLTGEQLDLYISEYTKNKESDHVVKVIDALLELTNNSRQEIEKIICDKLYKKTERFISTTTYGRIIGINARPTLFDFLRNKKLIEKESNKYRLTKEGMKYGEYLYTDKNEKFIGWNKRKLDTLTEEFRADIIRNLDFRLYHMTHISNLIGIFENGLFSHDKVKSYTDISNNDVNKRRRTKDNPHKISLHQYVPLYFNPRNAMLFTCQKKFGQDVVILEIDKSVISNDYTLFSEGNAARKDSNITTNKLDLANFRWEEINSLTWTNAVDDVNESLKSLMMSECLILNRIDPDKIMKVICSKESVSKALVNESLGRTEINVNENMFF
ncbi:DUF4433 domain-containing protein [Photobacterium damselae]|uniref:DUF4433 domain-containing protein n=1 Tax=Photobacterium damselae TaxID=38293 RepID=UPI00370CA945